MSNNDNDDDAPTKDNNSNTPHSLQSNSSDSDDDEFRSHSFRERRLTYSRHHILSDTAAAAVAELLAEGGDDFSDDDNDSADNNDALIEDDNEEEAMKVSAAEEGLKSATTTATASPQQQTSHKRRGSSFSAASDASSKLSSFYLPSRILHAGEIVRRYSNEQQQQLQQPVVGNVQHHSTQHDVRTGAYSHPTHHATSKNYHHHHHSTQPTHLHRNKWRQRFSFCSTAPDHILPFPRHIVGTFSCHGMEPVYDSDYDNSEEEEEENGDNTNNNNNTSIAKINQDRGGIIYPYANSQSMALFAVYDGHGEGGELVSQFALGEVSRILSGRLVDGLKGVKKKDRNGGGKRRRRGVLDCVHEEIVAAYTENGDDDDVDNDDDVDEEEEKDIIEQSFQETFIKVDRALLDEEEIEPMYSGTTACVVLKRHEKLFVANCGDSRAVLARRHCANGGDDNNNTPNDTQQQSSLFTTIPLSIDQNPDSPGEKERILDSGGYVSPPPEPGLTARVWLDSNMTQIGLAMARSIGDHAVKGVGVIAEPVVSVHNIDEELDDFVIIATDGVWEFISSEEAVGIVGKHLYGANGEKGDGDASEACEALIKAATAKWHEFEGDYRDDITAVVIRLKDLRKCTTV